MDDGLVNAFSGELGLPDGTAAPGTGLVFDLLLTTTARWRNDCLVEEYGFWDCALRAQ